MRSLYCLTWVATFNSVRITVDGWAVAKACERACGCGAHGEDISPARQQSRVALARKVVADVRSL
jgi:hypothetical protein